MKKGFKIVLIFLLDLISLIFLDTLQARVLKHSPLLHIRETLDGESYVDKGVLINTYYCTKEDKVHITWHFKTEKFTCPLEVEWTKKDYQEHLDKIINQGPVTSSNPFDYIEASNQDYQELLNHQKETFQYAVEDLINTKEDGLKSYIEALLCSKINQNFQYDFETGMDFLNHYQDFLTHCDCLYNSYDQYAKSLLKEKGEENMKLYIKIKDHVLSATLEENSSARALQEKLKESDLTFTLSDYSNFEKVGDLGFSLPTNNQQLQTDYGDLILYQGNSFVIYYDKNEWSLTKLGHIDNITQKELKSILGTGNVTITLTLKP